MNQRRRSTVVYRSSNEPAASPRSGPQDTLCYKLGRKSPFAVPDYNEFCWLAATFGHGDSCRATHDSADPPRSGPKVPCAISCGASRRPKARANFVPPSRRPGMELRIFRVLLIMNKIFQSSRQPCAAGRDTIDTAMTEKSKPRFVHRERTPQIESVLAQGNAAEVRSRAGS